MRGACRRGRGRNLRARAVVGVGFAAGVAVLIVLAVALTEKIVPPSRPSPPAPAPAPSRWVVDRSATEQLADLIGPRAAGGDTEARFGVAGTDLGHMFMAGGRLMIAFGDTYGGASDDDFFDGPHPDWRSNVLGWIDPNSDPAKGLALRGMVTDRPGHATELLPSLKQVGVEETVIPTSGISVGRRMFLHYMSVRRFPGGGHWPINSAGVAVSDDGGRTWDTPKGATWAGDTRFGQVAYVRPGGADDPEAPRTFPVPGLPNLMRMYPGARPAPPSPWVYVFGIPGGRYGNVSLALVPADDLLDTSAYRYWTGQGWSTDEEAAAPLVHGPVGELSVRWNSWYRRWLMTYLADPTGQIVLRTAPSPTGPWSAPQVITTTRDHPEAYAPYLTPRWTDGPDIWFTMSDFTDYRVSLMRTRLRPEPSDQPP